MKIKRWEDCAAFHGHECSGLAIGYKAALYAMELMGLEHSEDEQVVCIAESDACGIDAIQVMLGCTLGKGNLLFHLRGKAAYSFYDRCTGKALRLVKKTVGAELSKAERYEFYRACRPEELFEVKPVTIPLPGEARLYPSYVCDSCGELTGARWIRLAGEKKLCLDCYEDFDRFNV